MCDICNGRTYEQARRAMELHVIHHGWALQGVYPGEDDTDEGHWTYTIGLVENFDHPELILTDAEYTIAGEILNRIGEMVRSGDDMSQLANMGISLREVHPAHLDTDLFASWIDLYGHAPEPGQVLQIVLPDANYCPCHSVLRCDLSDPSQRPGSRRPNRAQRRAMQRAKRRRQQ